MAQTTHYFDDKAGGLSRETSHPRFVELASEDFYYDMCDDFSPFGSDDGHDALASLEDWYRGGGQDKDISTFLEALLNEWDFRVPKDLFRKNAETIETWISKEEMRDRYLRAECRAAVAAAFGQLKITGRAEADIVDTGLAAIRCQLWLNERAGQHYPEWKFAAEERAALLKMQAVLTQL